MGAGGFQMVELLSISTTTTNPAAGASFDLQPYVHAGGPQNFGISVFASAVTGTTGVCTVSIYDSTDGTTFSTVALGTAAVTTTTTNPTMTLVVPGLNRYINAQAALSGTSPNFTAQVVGLFQKRQV